MEFRRWGNQYQPRNDPHLREPRSLRRLLECHAAGRAVEHGRPVREREHDDRRHPRESVLRLRVPVQQLLGSSLRTYGDQILRRPSPCTDFYPWILYKGHPDTNPSFVYTLYRFDARVTNNLGYSVWQPVMLPVFNASVV